MAADGAGSDAEFSFVRQNIGSGFFDRTRDELLSQRLRREYEIALARRVYRNFAAGQGSTPAAELLREIPLPPVTALALLNELCDAEVLCRVRNTLISIGAEHPSAELVLELARHFRDYVLKGKSSLEIETQAVHRSGGAWILDREWIEKKLPEETRIWVEKRVLMLHPVNLKIFQYLRVDVRLTGLLSDLPLKPPLTELSVTPLFHEPALAVDSVCLAADSVCRENGAGFAVPLKLLLCFPDAGIFTGEWMDCRTPPSAEKMSRDLAESFCSMLSRIPFKVICK